MVCLNAKIDPRDAGILRGILSGSVRMQKRLHEAGLVESSLCPFCGLCDESVQHCFWECPRWEHVRARLDLLVSAVRNLWPACTFNCGIFMENEGVFNMMQSFQERGLDDLLASSKSSSIWIVLLESFFVCLNF